MRTIITVGLALLYLGMWSCKKDVDLAQYEQRTEYFRNINSGKEYDTSLVMATYNIQCGFPLGPSPWDMEATGGTPEHLEKLARFIDSTGADIVALQEVPMDRSNIVVKKLLDTLAYKLHMNYAFAAHGYNDAYGSSQPTASQWGVAILSKFPITETESREVSYLDIWTRRSTLRARIKLKEGQLIDVYSLHHKPMQDRSDLEKTAAFVRASNLPRLVAGDFNDVTSFVQPVLQLIQTMPDSLNGIDLIFNTKEFSTLSTHYSNGGRLSDHDCYWARLRFNP